MVLVAIGVSVLLFIVWVVLPSKFMRMRRKKSMVKRKDPSIDPAGAVLEVQLSGLKRLPRTRDLVDMLKEWYTWYNTYCSRLDNVGKTEELSTRTEDILKIWGRIDA